MVEDRFWPIVRTIQDTIELKSRKSRCGIPVHIYTANSKGDYHFIGLIELSKYLTDITFARTRGAKDKKPRKRKHYGVWFEGRRTAILPGPTESKAEAIEKARVKMKRGGTKAKVRELTPQEIKTANTGRWVRTGYNHEKPGYEGIRGYGPKPNSYKK
jgi:hypothetical protein